MEIYLIDFNGRPSPCGDWNTDHLSLEDSFVSHFRQDVDDRCVYVHYRDGRLRTIYNIDSIYERRKTPVKGN